MPEGDTIHRAAAKLDRALRGQAVTKFDFRRAPQGRRLPEAGAVVESVRAHGKHLVMRFDSGIELHTHMGLHGAWHLYGHRERWKRSAIRARVIMEVAGMTAVCFDAPLVEIRKRGEALRGVDALGPDLLVDDGDLADVVTRACRHGQGETEIAVVLLDQKVAAGIGNVYKSEVCWLERVSPFAPVGTLDDETVTRLYATARTLLRRNVDNPRRITYRDGYAVYRRNGERCFRCGTKIERAEQATRSTYWCPECQASAAEAR